MKTYKPNMIMLSTAVKRLQKHYGKDKIDRQLVLDMLEILGTQPYMSKITDDYFIDSYDYYSIDCAIYDYPKGAPVHPIFNIEALHRDKEI